MDKTFLIASTFFEVAKKGFKRGQYNPIARAFNIGGQYDVLIAITFSVMTVEAFLNELVILSKEREEPDAQSLFSSLNELSISKKLIKKPIEDRLIMASYCTSDTPIVKGNGIYQDFKLLIDIRNRIVHLLAGDTVDDGLRREHSQILTQLKNYGIISVNQSIVLHNEEEDDSITNLMHLPFISLVATEEVAKWSYMVVSKVILSFVDGMRESPFKNCLKDYTNGRFQELSQNDLDELLELRKIFRKFDCWTSDDFLTKIRKKELIVSIPTDG